MTIPAFVKLASELWRNYVVDGNPGSGNWEPVKGDIRAWGATIEAALNAALSGSTVLVNGRIDISVNANSLTIALKTLAGADPSASDPVYVFSRSATLNSGTPVINSVTAATSLVITAGSTMGVPDTGPFRLQLVGINDGATFRLGLFNSFASNVYYSLPESRIATSVAEGGAGAADSAGVLYTGTAVAAKPFFHIGSLTWSSGLAVPGNWSVAPTVYLGRQIEAGRRRLVGLGLANGTDANNDIDISTGWADADGDLGQIFLTSTLTKQSDAAWAAGSAAGGMDTGSKGTSTWLYVYLIGKSSDGSVDGLFSLSATAPTMPAGWDQKRRIGALRLDGSGNIRAFKQTEDEFRWSVVVNDLASTTNQGTAAVLRTLTVPPGMYAWFNYWLNNATTAALQALVTETQQPDTAPTTSLFDIRGTAAGQAQSTEMRRRVDASSQVRTRWSASGASDASMINTLGYLDSRGKLAN